jgi:hypothetical protein
MMIRVVVSMCAPLPPLLPLTPVFFCSGLHARSKHCDAITLQLAAAVSRFLVKFDRDYGDGFEDGILPYQGTAGRETCCDRSSSTPSTSFRSWAGSGGSWSGIWNGYQECGASIHYESRPLLRTGSKGIN